jgi:hypothetical protein
MQALISEITDDATGVSEFEPCGGGGDPIDEVNTAQKLCEQQRNQGVVFVGNKPVVCSQGFSADWARAQSVAVAWGCYKTTREEIGRFNPSPPPPALGPQMLAKAEAMNR